MRTLSQPKTSSKLILFAMLGVLLLAAYLRIHDLNKQGLWGDEGWTMWLARGDTIRDLTMTMVVDHHGPVYSILIRAWELLVGPSVVALRMSTVLFSLGSIALIYRLGRELWNPLAGVLVALAFTMMDKQIVLTQEVRDYPIIFFMMIGTAYFYVRWRHGKPGSAFGFVLFSVMGLYLQYYCYMVNLAILAHALCTLRGRPAWKHFIAINAAVALAFLPWTFIVLHQFINTPINEEVLTTTHGLPLNDSTVKYLASESFGIPIALYGLLFIAGIIGPALPHTPGPISSLQRNKRVSGMLLAALWFAIPLLITLALHNKYPLLTDRNISVIMPAIALLVGCGLATFERWGRLWLVGIIVIYGVFTWSAYFVKPPWKAMSADIARYMPPGEPVLVDVEGEHAALWYQLKLALPNTKDDFLNQLPGEAPDDPVVSLLYLRNEYGGNFVPRLQGILADTPGVWLAYWGDVAKKHDVFDVLDSSGFVRTATLNYQHHGFPIYAYRYDRREALANPIAQFGDLITLRKITSNGPAHPGDTAYALLWWSTDAPLTVDYTVSVFLLDANGNPLFAPGGGLLVQNDSFPQGGDFPSSGWTADATADANAFVFDAHPLHLPDTLPAGTYRIGVKLYTYWDGVVLPGSDGAAYQVVGSLAVEK